jgi:hypothetical protein
MITKQSKGYSMANATVISTPVIKEVVLTLTPKEAEWLRCITGDMTEGVDDEDGESGNIYTALSKAMWSGDEPCKA